MKTKIQDRQKRCDSEELTYGSKSWANHQLREGIKVLQDSKRVKSARFTEVLYYISQLERKGFWWQSRILRAWLHRYWHDLRPERVDPSEARRSSP